jgi:hypothetical protein
VEFSINSDFSTIDMSSGDTSNNHLGVKVSSMLEFAETLGLDDDPSTTFSDGSPNNTGMVYARVTDLLEVLLTDGVEQIEDLLLEMMFHF